MFDVTEKAGEMIKGLLEGKDPQSVRIIMTEGGCSGRSLGMALDAQQAEDEVFTEQGITFIIDKGLFDEVKPISIDFVQSAMGAGFMVKSALTAGGGGGCGSSGGSCCC